MLPQRFCTDDERDDAAVALAEKWWPERYVGDLTTAEWQRVYAAAVDQEPANG